MQEPTARKRGRRPEAREGQGQKPGIFLKVLPSEEYCRLKPMPEKTRPLGFEQKQGIAIWYCQSVNPAKQTAHANVVCGLTAGQNILIIAILVPLVFPFTILATQ
jgi:hypothetical protein